MIVAISGKDWKFILCGTLLFEMTNKRVGRQGGGEAGAVWTVYRQQQGAVVTHEHIRLVSRTNLLLPEVFQPYAQSSAWTGQCFVVVGNWWRVWKVLALYNVAGLSSRFQRSFDFMTP